jgi:UDP-2,3-diacylglucosamine pyrophosphatase LpxH
MKTKKYIIISDVHLGTKHTNVKELIKYLKNIKTKNLILNGDIVDGWAIDRGSKFREIDYEFIMTIMEISKTTNIYWIRGNHDDFLKDFLPNKIGNIHIIENMIIDLKENGKYFVFHGDILDVFITKYKVLSLVGSIGYDFCLYINKIYNLYRKWRNKPYFSISKVIKEKIKLATNHINNFEVMATTIAKQNNCTGVICGHIHQYENKMIEGIHYLNSGDWVENMSIILIDNDNNIKLKVFM